MCCFSQPVVSVTNTNLFARLSKSKTQFLAYQMEYQSEKPNAMILPLPVVPNGNEQGVKFVSLKNYENLFVDLDKGFPDLTPPPSSIWSLSRGDKVTAEAKLVVHEVGDFIASFVPTMNDFSRLDPQFVIPKESWDKIPEYADYGFAVFQLKELNGKPHPMAFEFETRWTDRIFFPTVHIHDGEVHELEEFDHTLYLQNAELDEVVGDYVNRNVKDRKTRMVRSMWPASEFCETERTEGIVEPSLLVHRFEMRGNLKNQDVVLSKSPAREGHASRENSNAAEFGPTMEGMDDAISSQPASLVRYWPVVPALLGVAGIGWLFHRRDLLRR